MQTPGVGAGFPGVAVRLPGETQLHLATADSQALTWMIQTLVRMDAERAGGESC